MARSYRSHVMLPRRRVSQNVSGDPIIRPAWVRDMVEKISDLPGVVCTSGSGLSPGMPQRFVLIEEDAGYPVAGQPCLLLDIDPAGRMTLDPPPRLRREILRSGWGECRGQQIRTFSPGDAVEAAVIWRIVLMLYFKLRGTGSGLEPASSIDVVGGSPACGSTNPRLTSGSFY